MRSEMSCYLLRKVQMSMINNDYETFIDRKLKSLSNISLANWRECQAANLSPSTSDIREFVDANFDHESAAFKNWITDDSVENS